MKLLVSGCSFTDPKLNSWPQLLFKDKKVDVVNFGKPGAGNASWLFIDEISVE
jgi:hypothetical protein